MSRGFDSYCCRNPCQLFALEGQHSKGILNMPAHVCHLLIIESCSLHNGLQEVGSHWDDVAIAFGISLCSYSLALYICHWVDRTCACACRSLDYKMRGGGWQLLMLSLHCSQCFRSARVWRLVTAMMTRLQSIG